MMAFYRYFEAKRMLKSSEETIQALGGEDASDPMMPMLMGQRDYHKLAIDHWAEQSRHIFYYMLVALFSISMYYVFFKH